MATWGIREYPTIYVIDAQGVIRYKDLSDDKLEKAVHELLDEKVVKTAG